MHFCVILPDSREREGKEKRKKKNKKIKSRALNLSDLLKAIAILAEATGTLISSLIGVLLRDYSKGYGSTLFLFLCHPVMANYFQLKSIERKEKGDCQYQSLPGQVNLAISSGYSVMSLIPTAARALKMRKPHA